ncbi:MAG: 3-methyl-2-oxobutanoate hydroxymethyltransferase [Gammaproteobacteria bacterium]|nr:3-methyl-2-oxobutanoate hydroxymethyltransferase [Gammaproteobacteria bacterium]
MNTPAQFAAAKRRGEKIVFVTCYDAPTARLVAGSEVDAVLVGDSVAMAVHGFRDTVAADVPMMALHTAAVRRGLGPEGFVVADLPFLSHRRGRGALMRAVEALVRAGANAVKLEGVDGSEADIRHVVESGVPVMGHIGLTPQHVHALGGFNYQGKSPEAAAALRDQAQRLQDCGVFSLVIECVPRSVAAGITRSLAVPTIGIGAGPDCDGQVLVITDLLGLDPGFKPRFVRRYLDAATQVSSALDAYARDVKGGRFPGPQETFGGEESDAAPPARRAAAP